MTLPDKAQVQKLQEAKDLLVKWRVLNNTERVRIQGKLDKLAGEEWTKWKHPWGKGGKS